MTGNGTSALTAVGGDTRFAAPSSARGDLLASVVAVARSVFGAAASSVLLLDEAAGELVFAAVAGAGAESLVGRRFSADRGIAGWVAATGEPMIVDQLSASAVFARDVAESTGYVPESIMAAQISHDGTCLGVLEVLDMNRRSRADFGDLDLLTLLAQQASIALRGPDFGGCELASSDHSRSDLGRSDPGRSDLGRASGADAERAAVAGLIRQLESWEPSAQQAACRMLQALVSFFGEAGA